MYNPQNKGYQVLLIFITIFFCVGASPQTQPPTQGNSSKVTDKVIVYYFHGNSRCGSCMTIERYTRESVEATFAKELKSGQIEFRSINVELPYNNHYVNDYKLYTKSVIVSDMVQGKEQRWKNLQKVWELLRSEKEFKAYVKSETAAYLQGKRS
jgi:thiol-disulfide isomerase/thioredoxin